MYIYIYMCVCVCMCELMESLLHRDFTELKC